jgi:hypothetical protein
MNLSKKAFVASPPAGPAADRVPTVSVVIPCYNYGEFLPSSIGSALDQVGVRPEVIVVDDASTDGSAAVAEQYASVDERVRVVRHRANRGHVVTFNDGLAVATGEFVVRLDADDLLTPGSLARAVALFDAYPSVGLVYGHPRHFVGAPPAPRSELRSWSVWAGEDWVALRCRTGVNCITTPEAMVRRSVLDVIGPLSTALSFAQDMEMWLRVASVSDVGRVDGPDQALHRDHPASMSATTGSGRILDLEERRTVFEVLFSGFGGALADAAQLHERARRALAAEALVHAYRAYDRGRTATEPVEQLIDFALATYARTKELPQWRALQRRRRVGARLAPYYPVFIGSAAHRRFQYIREHRAWARTGL